MLTEAAVVQLKTLSESLTETTQNTMRNLKIADRGLNTGLNECCTPGLPPSSEFSVYWFSYLAPKAFPSIG